MNGEPPLRILAISHLFPHAAETRYGIFVARQLEAMARQNAEITVLVPRLYCPAWLRKLLGKPDSYDHQLELVPVPGLETHAIPYVGLPGLWFTQWSGWSIFQATKTTAVALHQKRPFDVIYTTELFLGGDAGRRLSRLLSIPSACLAIGGDVNWTAKRSASSAAHYKTIVAGLEGTLACGQSVADEIQQLKPQHETLCVYGVVDLDLFAPQDAITRQTLREKLRLSPDKHSLLYVGYLWEEKGLLDLIRAFECVMERHPDVELVLCGVGKDEHAIRQLALQSPASSRVRFDGSVTPEKVPEYMQAADLFVFPSHDEGMPNVVMESLACGCPVVSTAVGGLKQALTGCDGVTLVPPRDPNAFAAAVNDVLSSESRPSMSKAARATATQQFDVNTNAARIVTYLRRVATRTS